MDKKTEVSKEVEAAAIGQATDNDIAQWKQKHGDVYEVTATEPNTGKEHKGYLRKPKRAEISYATKIANSNPLGFNESILTSCWLGGSEAIRTNDALFMGVSGQLTEIIEVAEASIKKL